LGIKRRMGKDERGIDGSGKKEEKDSDIWKF
jgi:hypothetical protein